MSVDTARNGRATDLDESPYLVVSIDSHLGPLFDHLKPYCPEAYKDRFDQWVNTWMSYWGGKRSWFADDSPMSVRWGGIPFGKVVVERQDQLLETTGIYDPEVHLKEMDADGVAAELLYHTAFTPEILPFQSLGMVATYEDLELEAVGLEMYNRWLVDFVSVSPGALHRSRLRPHLGRRGQRQDGALGARGRAQVHQLPRPQSGLCRLQRSELRAVLGCLQ